MMLMCLVTEAPGPVTTGVFEALEEAEETHAARRRKAASRPATADRAPRPPALAAVAVVQSTPTVRPQSIARPVTHDFARKIPAAAREPSAVSEDH
jgi:hypothetical protein